MKDDDLNFSHGVKLPAHMDSLQTFIDFIGNSAKELGIEDTLIQKLKLVAEELLVNVVHYAYAESGKDGDIELQCGMADAELFCMRIADKGKPFNPFSAPEPDLTRGIEDRPVGGLGVFLVRELADRLDYWRKDGANVVLFCKKVQIQPAA